MNSSIIRIPILLNWLSTKSGEGLSSGAA
jgi:hypothetical protein